MFLFFENIQDGVAHCLTHCMIRKLRGVYKARRQARSTYTTVAIFAGAVLSTRRTCTFFPLIAQVPLRDTVRQSIRFAILRKMFYL